MGTDTEDTPVEGMSFEDAMAELETVVSALEKGDVPLAEAIARYERGAVLKAHCEAQLRQAEAKVAQITQDAEGRAVGAEPTEIG